LRARAVASLARHSFPTRRSSDLKALATMMMVGSLVALFTALLMGSIGAEVLKRYAGFSGNAVSATIVSVAVSILGIFVFLASARSEEHTSELQSRVDLVCRLLLE